MTSEPALLREDLAIEKEANLNRSQRVRGGKSQKRKRLKKDMLKKTKKRKRKRGNTAAGGSRLHKTGFPAAGELLGKFLWWLAFWFSLPF